MATTISIDQEVSALPQKKGDPPNFGTVKSGRALAFDGVVDSLTFSIDTKPLNNVTVACWINSTFAEDWDTILGHADGFGDYIWFQIKNDGTIACALKGVDGGGADAYGDFISASSTTIVANTWQRVVMTYDSTSGGVIYVDGVSVATTSSIGAIDDDAGNLQIGKSGSSNYHFGGNMSDWQLWDATWTATDVTNDYTHPEMLAHTFGGTSLTESNLKVWYPMTEGNPESPQTTIFDGSGNKNHATSVFYGDEMITVNKDKNLLDANNWNVSDGAWSYDVTNDELDFTGSGTGTTALDQTYPAFVVGKTYEIRFGNDNGDDDTTITWKDGDGSNTLVAEATYSNGTKTATFIAPATTDGLLIAPASGSGAFSIEWVNVKEVGLSTTGHVEGQETIFQPAFVGQNRMIAFDGANDYVTCGVNPHSIATFSLSLWFSCSSVTDLTNNALITFGDSSTAHFTVSVYEQEIYASYENGSGDIRTKSNGLDLFENDKWYHLACSNSSGTLTWYVNGSAVTVATSQTLTAQSCGDLFEIGRNNNKSSYFNGFITEVSIFSGTALSSTQVQELYNDGVPLDLTSNILTDSPTLSGYWRNNVLHTDSTWKDLSTNSNNGTLSGGSTVIFPEGTTSGRDINGFFLTHPNKNYLSLDGTDGCHIEVPDSEVLDGYDVMTWSFWIKPHSLADDDTILDKWVETDNQRSWRMYIDDSNEIALHISSTGANDEIQKTTDLNLTLNTWWYITIVFNAGTFTVYKNNATGVTEDANFGTTLTIFNSSANLLIGDGNVAAMTAFDGLIDDVRIYNRALDEDEIKKNYRHGSGKHKD